MSEANPILKGELKIIPEANLDELQVGTIAWCPDYTGISGGALVYRNSSGTVKAILDVTAGTAYIDATELATALADYRAKAEYKVYRALLTQSGGDAPTVQVIDNELSAAIVWTRSSSGVYYGTLAGAFTANKTFCMCHVGSPTTGDGRLSRVDADKVVIQTVDVGAPSNIGSTIDSVLPALADSILNNASIEILVYP